MDRQWKDPEQTRLQGDDAGPEECEPRRSLKEEIWDAAIGKIQTMGNSRGSRELSGFQQAVDCKTAVVGQGWGSSDSDNGSGLESSVWEWEPEPNGRAGGAGGRFWAVLNTWESRISKGAATTVACVR